MRYEIIHCSNETMYRGNRVWFGWSHLRLSFAFLIEVCDMAGIGMTSWSDVVNALEQDFSGIGISTFGDMFLGEKVPRFIVSQVNADKSIDLIGRVKSTNITKFANNTCFLLSQATQTAPATSIWYFILWLLLITIVLCLIRPKRLEAIRRLSNWHFKQHFISTPIRPNFIKISYQVFIYSYQDFTDIKLLILL